MRLTWEELANLYDKEHSGRKARTLPMDTVLAWAERHPDKFFFDEEGYLYRNHDRTQNTDCA
jgi:hypothetical protein